MPKCVYCKDTYEFPRGLTLVMKDGKVNYLCSSKCRKNMLMKRRKVRWVLAKAKTALKEKIALKEKTEVKKEIAPKGVPSKEGKEGKKAVEKKKE